MHEDENERALDTLHTRRVIRQLEGALDRKGDFIHARAEYDRFATAHPQSQLAVFAMRRSATLAHTPAPVVAPVIAP